MRRWPLNTAYFWQEAPFFRLLVPLICAIICYDKSWLPFHHVWFWCLGSILLFVLLIFFRQGGKPYQYLLFVAFQLAVFCFGWWRMSVDDIRRNPDWFGHNISTNSAQLVRVMDEPAEKDRSWKLHIQTIKTFTGKTYSTSVGEAFLSIYKKDSVLNIHKGDELVVPADWQPIINAGNPFEFDYARFCSRHNIYYQQFVGPDQVLLYKKALKIEPSFIERIHNYSQSGLDRYLKDTVTRGLMQAMLLGDESGFDPALRQAYADTGVIHIVSISGSHVAVLFLMITSLLFWLKGRSGQWIKYIVGAVAVWIYVLMAGAPPSAVRSATMFSIIAMGTMFSRQPHPLNTLLGAAFILLCGNPNWLFAVGFQLSFAAVSSLLLFYGPIYKCWPQTTFIGRKLWQAVTASIAAELLTAPLGIYYFHNFPLFFALANILAAALLSFLALVGGMAIIAFSWLPPLASALAFIITRLVKIFDSTILQLQCWNPASFKYLQLSGPGLILLYLSITMLAFALLRKQRKIFGVGMGTACLLLISLCIDKYRVLHQDKLIAYNLGRNAEVALIRGNRHEPIYTDTTAKEHYILNSSFTGFQAWKLSRQSPANAYFLFKGQRVLQLSDDIPLPDKPPFPVDILMIERPLKGLSPARVQTAFQPRQMVIISGQSRYLIKKWQDSCLKMKIPLHAVSANGAFLLQ